MLALIYRHASGYLTILSLIFSSFWFSFFFHQQLKEKNAGHSTLLI